jgi:hypothetical protein
MQIDKRLVDTSIPVATWSGLRTRLARTDRISVRRAGSLRRLMRRCRDSTHAGGGCRMRSAHREASVRGAVVGPVRAARVRNEAAALLVTPRDVFRLVLVDAVPAHICMDTRLGHSPQQQIQCTQQTGVPSKRANVSGLITIGMASVPVMYSSPASACSQCEPHVPLPPESCDSCQPSCSRQPHSYTSSKRNSIACSYSDNHKSMPPGESRSEMSS